MANNIIRVHGQHAVDEQSYSTPAFAVLAEFSFAYTTSAQSAAITHASIKAGTTHCVVRVSPNTDAWLAFGDNPTAILDQGLFLAAGESMLLRVPVGSKIAAVQDSSGGTLSVVILE